MRRWKVVACGQSRYEPLHSSMGRLSASERSIMAGVNKVILIGNLGQDPEVRMTNSGTPVCELRLACTDRRRTQDGQWEDQTEWVTVVTFGRTAENAGKFLSKGRSVYVEGRMQTRSWDDQEGKKRYKTEVVAQIVQFSVGGESDGYSGSSGGGYGGSKQGAAAMAAVNKAAAGGGQQGGGYGGGQQGGGYGGGQQGGGYGGGQQGGGYGGGQQGGGYGGGQQGGGYGGYGAQSPVTATPTAARRLRRARRRLHSRPHSRLHSHSAGLKRPAASAQSRLQLRR